MKEQELASVKKPNEVEYISREEYDRRVKTIAKCKRDICYWAETYFRIINPQSGLQIIKLYPKQKEMLQHMIDNNRSIICASRQIGRLFATSF